jgi:hypothetical protein
MGSDVPRSGTSGVSELIIPGPEVAMIGELSTRELLSFLTLGAAALAVTVSIVAVHAVRGQERTGPRAVALSVIFVTGSLYVIFAGMVFGPRIGLPMGFAFDPSVGSEGAAAFSAIVLGAAIVTLALTQHRHGGLWRKNTSDSRMQPAVVLALLGAASLVGWFFLGSDPGAPLLYFGGIGLFGAILVPLLLPDRTVAPIVAEGLHEALVSTADPGTDGSDARRMAVYDPGSPPAGPAGVQVYTLETTDQDVDLVDAGSAAVTGGSSLRSRPSGVGVYQAFTSEAVPDVGTSTETFAWQLCRGLTDWLELATSATPEAETEGGITVRVAGSTVPGVDRFDHPIVSFLGVALACHRDRAVVTDVQPVPENPGEHRISVHPLAVVPGEDPSSVGVQLESDPQ